MLVIKGTDERRMLKDGLCFVASDDSSLNLERDLRIRDDGRKKEGMGMPACIAGDT